MLASYKGQGKTQMFNIEIKKNKQKNHVPATTNNKTTSIYSTLPLPHLLNVVHVDVGNVFEVSRGLDEGCQQKPSNLQEGVSKRGSLSHVPHERVYTDHGSDLRASAIPI